MTHPLQPLDYRVPSPPPRRLLLTPGQRWLIVAGAVTGLLALAVACGLPRAAWRWVDQRYRWRQVRDVSEVPGRLVLTDARGAGAGWFPRPPGRLLYAAVASDPRWCAPNLMVTYAHRHRDPSGTDHLVVVHYRWVQSSRRTTGDALSFWVGVYRPDRWNGFAPDVELPLDRFPHVRTVHLFTGTPDPRDPSRFTIPFDVDGTPGVLDGRLGTDAVPTLRVHSSAPPSTAPAGRAAIDLRLPESPTTPDK